MIIAHLPAGYITSKMLYSRFQSRGCSLKLFFWSGIFGSIAPDLDMAYFYLIDKRQHHHHTYWIHFPVVWFSMLIFSVIWLYSGRFVNRAALSFIFSLNGIIHMLLDSVVGDICWSAPFSDKPFSLFTVPALYNPWWLNFLLHWSFYLELAIIVLALCLWYRTSNSSLASLVKELFI
jgi:inner membrane protein